jgi:hypothetical protein
MAGNEDPDLEATQINVDPPGSPPTHAPDQEGVGEGDILEGAQHSRGVDGGEVPVWRTALEVSLARDFASEADVMRVYSALAKDRSNADLRALLKRTLDVYQERLGQIEDLFVTDGEKWAVIRTVSHRPKRFPFFRSSTIDTFFDIEAAKPPAVGEAFSTLSDLTVKSDHVLRGVDQVSFAKELAFAFENIVGQVSDANGAPLSDEQVSVLNKEVARLDAMWTTSAVRGVPITTLEGMGIGVICVTLVAAVLGTLLRGANIADFHVSTFVGVAVAGAIGAVISVLTRMSAGTFRVPVETARTNVRVLGSIRPLIGSTFAVVIVFGLIGQLLGVQTVVDDNHRFYAYFVFAFLSGFSERWAQNLLIGIGGRVAANDPPPPPPDDQATPNVQPDRVDPTQAANERPAVGRDQLQPEKPEDNPAKPPE